MAACIPVEYSYSPICGSYGVQVTRAKPQFETSASMEILYDEIIDYNYTAHRAIIPWNGVKVTAAYVERLLNLANVPVNIQQDSAVNMVLRCVDGILKDPKRPKLCSVYVEIMSDKDTADYGDIFGKNEDDDEEEEEDDVKVQEQGKV